MSQALFAVVGHVNKGKSSVVATLAEDDSVVISGQARTTRECRRFEYRVHGETLFTLIDTPGFEQARHALAWLKEHPVSAAERSKTVEKFLADRSVRERFPEECRLLQPIMEGAGILYIVDGSRPFSPEYQTEMEILRWTGRPRMAMINVIGERDHTAQWRAALDQYFSLTRDFNAHQADYALRLQLLKAFRELRDDWRPSMDRAIEKMENDRRIRLRESARAIADMMTEQLSLTLKKKINSQDQVPKAKEKLEKHYLDRLRKRERLERDQVEDLYHHNALRRDESQLDVLTDDLFAQTTWNRLGLHGKQLMMTGAVGGALIGGGLDAVVGGASFMVGTVIGAAVGSVGAWMSEESLAQITVYGLKFGGKMAKIGPMKNPRFPWIVLDRALIHHRLVSRRSHARRDELGAENARRSGPVSSSLPLGTRRRLVACFGRLRRGSKLKIFSGEDARRELVEILEKLMEEQGEGE